MLLGIHQLANPQDCGNQLHIFKEKARGCSWIPLQEASSMENRSTSYCSNHQRPRRYGPRVSVPPPMNLPSLRKERDDQSLAAGARNIAPGNASSALGWKKLRSSATTQVKKPLESNFEKVQKMPQKERVTIENARALDLARKEEEKQRLVREEEERRRRLEEEARKAATKVEEERLGEALKIAEHQKVAKGEEKRRLQLEEERQKVTPTQEVLDASIVKDDNESEIMTGQDKLKATNPERREEVDGNVERITSSTISNVEEDGNLLSRCDSQSTHSVSSSPDSPTHIPYKDSNDSQGFNIPPVVADVKVRDISENEQLMSFSEGIEVVTTLASSKDEKLDVQIENGELHEEYDEEETYHTSSLLDPASYSVGARVRGKSEPMVPSIVGLGKSLEVYETGQSNQEEKEEEESGNCVWLLLEGFATLFQRAFRREEGVMRRSKRTNNGGLEVDAPPSQCSPSARDTMEELQKSILTIYC